MNSVAGTPPADPGPAPPDGAARQPAGQRYRPAPRVIGGQFQIQSRLPIVLLAALSALLAYLAFPPVSAWPFIFVCLAPWCVCVCTAARSRWLYFVSFLLGIAFFAINVYWLAAVTFPGYVALCLAFGAVFPLAAWPVRHMYRRYSSSVALTLPIVWVGLEFLRGQTLAGFPWLYLAHALYRVPPLIQVADLGGVFAVSFVAAMVNGWITDLLVQPILLWMRDRPEHAARLPVGSVSTVIILLGAYLYGIARLAETDTARRPGPRVAIIQHDFPLAVSADVLGRVTPETMLQSYFHVARRAAADRPDLIVFPETAWPAEMNPAFLNATAADLDAIRARLHANQPGVTVRVLERWRDHCRAALNAVQALADETGATIVIGGQATQWQPQRIPPRVERFNSAYVLPPHADRQPERYDKIHLVLFGEFVPFRYTTWHSLYEWLNSLTPWGANGVEYSLTFGESFHRFQCSAPSVGGRTFRFATPICYEDTVSHVIRGFVGSGAAKEVDFLLNISNDGWFHHSSELELHLAASVFRAVEFRLPMARAVNTGISTFVDPTGVIHHRVRLTRSGAARLADADAALARLESLAAKLADRYAAGGSRSDPQIRALLDDVSALITVTLRQAIEAIPDPAAASAPASAASRPAVPAFGPPLVNEFDFIRLRLLDMAFSRESAAQEAQRWANVARQARADRATLDRWRRKDETAPGYRVASLACDVRQTVYAQWGDWFAASLLVLTALMALDWIIFKLRRPSRRRRRLAARQEAAS